MNSLNREISWCYLNLRCRTRNGYYIRTRFDGRECSANLVVSVLGCESVRIHSVAIDVDIIDQVLCGYRLASDGDRDGSRAFDMDERF